MRVIVGFWKPPEPLARSRLKRATLYIGDRPMVSIVYHRQLGFTWFLAPGDGLIYARRGAGRVRTTGGARALYLGSEETKRVLATLRHELEDAEGLFERYFLWLTKYGGAKDKVSP